MVATLPVRAVLLVGAAFLPLTEVRAQAAGDAAPATQTPQENPAVSTPPAVAESADDVEPLEEIVVTGTTSRNRRLITSSADITVATAEDIDRKAPRSTADLLELVPGIFVEGTAGAISNNYSVRGLQGGGQRFVTLEEDGMPIIYQGGGADFFFQQDLTIDRLEAVKGGSSGVLSVNGAGATINFISRALSFDEFEGTARVTGYDYGLLRGDFYLSAPLAENLAVSVGGYVSTSPGVRRNPFDHETYRIKAALEYRFANGGFARVTGRYGDLEEAYYAGQPYRLDDGDVRGLPGFDVQRDNIGGRAFGRVEVPVSTFVEEDGFRTFRLSRGVKVETKQIRLDVQSPLTDSLDVFLRARYLDLSFDFNGLFPGSGTGNAGLASALTYVTPGAASPINDLLTRGQAAFPTAARFGIRNVRDGAVIGADNVAALNGLNGNGFLQQTTLNHDEQAGHDLGTNFGARWEYQGSGFVNSVRFGGMFYDVKRKQNQSATTSAINDVSNDSDIYDVVALDANNNVIGELTDNGLISYGNWGAGIRENDLTSVSVYVNDELAIGDKLRIDAGIRYETINAEFRDGNSAAVNQPVPPGVGGLARDVGSTFNGTFTTRVEKRDATAWTVGANYLILDNLAVYGRYARGFQTNGVDPITEIELYEGGVRFQGRYITGSVTYFQTFFDDQFYNFIDPLDPTRQTAFLGDLQTDGVEIDVTLRPFRGFTIDFQGVFQSPELTSLELNGIPDPTFNGNLPERTPEQLYTITPTFRFPDGRGEIYARYKHIGEIFADSGNGVALPAYGVTSVGVVFNINDRLQLSANADNIFNEIGLTEGNPRQGQRQNADSGFFYARGIVGPTYGGSVTLRF